jgi:predicted metal-dependent hydrolase
MLFFIKDRTQRTRTVVLENIGEILLVQSYKNRNFRISVKPFEPVRVSFPNYMSFEKAEQELRNKLQWLSKTKAKIRVYETQTRENGQQGGPLNKKELEKNLRREAKKYLPPRTAELAARHGLRYSKLTIRNSRTRWGSCSARNSINLSLYLMRLSPELIDYVIMHELVHTIAHDHSKNYWSLLENYLPGARMLEKKLKQQRTQVW